MKYKLFMLEKVGYYDNKYFYWAKDEGEAIDIHEKLTDESDGWVASQVFANNLEKENHGFVDRQGERETYNSGWQDGYRDGYRDAVGELLTKVNLNIAEMNNKLKGE